MQPDLLQQLRDIHLPADPLWWPPAPGWWLLALLGIGAIIWLGGQLRAAHRRRQPLKLARRYYDEVYAAFSRGEIDAPAYLQQTNELLKRLYIHGIGDDQARSANDANWLSYLDEQSGGSAFTQGPGAQLGNQRFRPAPEVDPDTLHPLVARLFRNARP
jgi:hypothetical protein